MKKLHLVILFMVCTLSISVVNESCKKEETPQYFKIQYCTDIIDNGSGHDFANFNHELQADKNRTILKTLFSIYMVDLSFVYDDDDKLIEIRRKLSYGSDKLKYSFVYKDNSDQVSFIWNENYWGEPLISYCDYNDNGFLQLKTNYRVYNSDTILFSTTEYIYNDLSVNALINNQQI